MVFNNAYIIYFYCIIFLRRKRSDKNEVIPVQTQGHQIANKLKMEYMEQLVRDVKRQQDEYQ